MSNYNEQLKKRDAAMYLQYVGGIQVTTFAGLLEESSNPWSAIEELNSRVKFGRINGADHDKILSIIDGKVNMYPFKNLRLERIQLPNFTVQLVYCDKDTTVYKAEAITYPDTVRYFVCHQFGFYYVKETNVNYEVIDSLFRELMSADEVKQSAQCNTLLEEGMLWGQLRDAMRSKTSGEICTILKESNVLTDNQIKTLIAEFVKS